MKPILFESNETQFTSNGLGRIDAMSCVVTEARNGQYDLEMEVSIEDEHYADIREGRILYVRHDETTDKQPFDIYSMSRPLNGIVTVYASHVSYRTQGITVMPFSANGIALAMQGLNTNSVGNNPFTFWTNKTSTGKFDLSSPRTLRSLLAGEEGSLLDVFGTGEYEWDKFTIKLHSRRGIDSGVVLRYGKDITELTKTTTTESFWTGVVPFWRGNRAIEDNDGTTYEEVTVTLPEEYILAQNSGVYPHQVIIPLDLSSSFDDEPTEAQLRQAATQYVTNNAPSAIPTTIEFSFVNTAALEEYKGVAALQRLKLCDTVSIQYTKLGVSNTAKIIETQYDVLAEKYIGLKVGDVAPSLSTVLTEGISEDLNQLAAATQQGLKSVQTHLEIEFEKTIEEQTALITGGNGGHVVTRLNANKKPYEILITDDEDVDQATNILRLNINGIGFSNHGINGPYNTAWTLDGKFNADYIQTGTLNASLIKAGSLSADYIHGGTLVLGGDNNENGLLQVKDANSAEIVKLDKNGISISSGSINLGSGKFRVLADGTMSCTGASISGDVHCTDSLNALYVDIKDGKISGGYTNISPSVRPCIDFRGIGNSPDIFMSSSNIYFDAFNLYVRDGTNNFINGITQTFDVVTGNVQLDTFTYDYTTGNWSADISWNKSSLRFLDGLLVSIS